jgi:hypothetical protein
MTQESLPIPTIRHGTSPGVEEVLDHLVIKVDRLHQTNKILKWVASAAITFALGSAFAVARMLYGMGADDAMTRNGIERAQRQADENKADVRELQKFVYRRFGVDATKATPPTREDLQ